MTITCQGEEKKLEIDHIQEKKWKKAEGVLVKGAVEDNLARFFNESSEAKVNPYSHQARSHKFVCAAAKLLFMPVGQEVTFSCDKDRYFIGEWYLRPTQTATCKVKEFCFLRTVK